MRIGKRLFPYPLLNNDKLYSQYKESTFALEYEEVLTEANYVLNNIKCEITSSYLIELIETGKASIICVVECAPTMFRKTYKLSLEPQKIAIPLRDLNGKISVSAFVVANQDIENYYSEDFDDDYDGYEFTIEKNDILAVDDGFTNKIEFDEDEDNKKSSIFLIIKDLSIKDETMRVEYDTNKITILLPESQWNLYDKSKSNSNLNFLYFSVLAIPALTYALGKLQAKAETGVDILRIDYKWFNSFAKQYKNIHNEELTDEVFGKMNVNLEAQILMNTPVTKAIDDIFSFTMGSLGGNEDVD